MIKETVIKFAINIITVLVVISFFLFSIIIPFHQIFSESTIININLFGWIISAVFFIDLLSKLIIFSRNTNETEFLAENDLSNYLKSYFIVDFIAVIPIAVFPDPSLWQLLPLIKIFSVFRRISFIQQTILKFASLSVVMQFFYWFAQITHWITCGWLKLGGISEEHSVASNYVSALYWTTTTLTTVGYGDIVPHTNIEKLYAIFVMILGVGFYGYLIGNVVSVITKRDPAHEKFIANLDNLSALLKYRNLPPKLTTRIRQYFMYMWKHRLDSNEDEFINKLPEGLKLELITYLKQDMIKNLDLFHNVSQEFITDFANKLKESVITPNEYLFHEGDVGNKVFFIIKGELSVLTKNDSKVIAKLKSGDIVGEIALFKDKLRNASVKADTFCHLYYLEKDSFDLLIPKYPEMAKKIEAKILEREHQ